MRHKYVITRNQENEELALQEYTDVDKDTFSLICEVKYKNSDIASAAAQGLEALISTLRTTDFFPCGSFATQIAESVQMLYGPEGNTLAEVYCEDLSAADKEADKEKDVVELAEEPEETEEESTDIDGLLADDFHGKVSTKGIDSALSIDTTEATDVSSDA